MYQYTIGLVRMHEKLDKTPILFTNQSIDLFIKRWQFAPEASGLQNPSSVSQSLSREKDLMVTADQPILVSSASDGLSFHQRQFFNLPIQVAGERRA